ncbi:MAG TPA: 2-dehydropantoate 2-reductase [Acidimicrobiales bacterium]|jgi:2-dehydropantoate 2-reductase|nr:2-dehydropantoate 2-reductase [Acidimicrobiales bacterium]
MARVVVIGTGSIGGYFAGELAEAGHEVVMCSRRPFDRLVVEHLDGSKVEVDSPALTDPAHVPHGDWVMLATKAHQVPDVAGWLAGACGPSTKAVVVMQNGVDHEGRVAPYVDGTPVLSSIVLCGAEAVAPGHVVHHGASNLEVPRGEMSEELAALFVGTRVNIVFHDDFVSAQWRKLIQNVTAAPITAITTRRMGVLRNAAVKALAIGLAEECIHVANAVGAHIPIEEAVSSIELMGRVNPSMGSSMLYDRLAGRPLEYQYLTGAVTHYGETNQIPTPLNDALYALLSGISEGPPS